MEKVMEDPNWYNDPGHVLRLYHGTTSLYRASFESQGLQIVRRKNKRRDFGDGFYSTTHRAQAQDYAKQTAVAAGDGGGPLVVVCEIQVQKLRDLIPHALVTT